MNNDKITIFWFRRDLRLHDNPALFYALQKGNVLPIFIFDTCILSQLPDNSDARVTYIFNQLQVIDSQLSEYNSAIKIYFGNPEDVYKKILEEYNVESVFFNEDYEPYGMKRDQHIENIVRSKGIACLKFQDHILCHPSEIKKSDETPYTVYTPFSKKWKEVYFSKQINLYASESLLSHCTKNTRSEITLSDIGFVKNQTRIPILNLSDDLLTSYKNTRDFPYLDATTHLGTTLRFGVVSIRETTKQIISKSETLLNELIWREFFIHILYHYPKVVNHSFKSKYDAIPWRNNEDEFEKWKNGETGYPIVDAGMRELNRTGFMHNRVRMITASFLCKHLLIDWRWGEAYFATKLLDFELASNNGNWQWASGSGCDAVPYFRIFNPDLQTQKFDPEFIYIRKWVPELEELSYPTPIVEHSFARNRAIETYKNALNK